MNSVNQVEPYVLSEAEDEAIRYINNRATIKATAQQTGGAFGLVGMLVAPNHPIPLHIHHAEDEALWGLEGNLTVQAGDTTYSAGPGSFIFGPKGVRHTFRAESTTGARLLVLMVPGGGEGFFIETGRPAEGEGLPTPTSPDSALMQAKVYAGQDGKISPGSRGPTSTTDLKRPKMHRCTPHESQVTLR
ncbi:MAG: cupin domain-containing protein [Chloroflexota bacterium]